MVVPAFVMPLPLERHIRDDPVDSQTAWVTMNIKIRTMLAVGFGATTVLLSGIIVISIVGLNRLGGSVEDLTSQRIPALISVGSATQMLLGNSTRMKNTVLANGVTQSKSDSDEVRATSKVIDSLLNDFSGKFHGDTEQTLYKEVMSARALYQPLEEEFLRLIDKGDKVAATSLMLEGLDVAQQRYVGKMTQLIEHVSAESDLEAAKSKSAVTTTRSILLACALLAILFALVASWFIVRYIMRRFGGEPGYAAELAGRIADGDLGRELHEPRADAGSLISSMRTMRDGLANAVKRIIDSACKVESKARQITASSVETSSRTEEQASTIEEVASAMEQLLSTVKQNAGHAGNADNLALSSLQIAEKGGEAMRDIANIMKDISTSSARISEINTLIDGIAFQTNILALNAAVEAARAGEQGKGFGVVAAEVRTLAQRSATAAKEIKDLIQQSAAKVNLGASKVRAAEATMGEIVTSTQRVARVIGEIAKSSLEQESGISQINHAVMQMEQTTQHGAALVEESAAAAEDLSATANELLLAVDQFKLPDRQGLLANAERNPRLHSPT